MLPWKDLLKVSGLLTAFVLAGQLDQQYTHATSDSWRVFPAPAPAPTGCGAAASDRIASAPASVPH